MRFMKHFAFSMSALAAFLFFATVGGAYASSDSAILAQLRTRLVEKPSDVRETLLPGLYGVYFNNAEARTFVDRKLTILGNQFTGYAYLSGPRQGEDLTPEESRQLFKEFLAAIPRDLLVRYRYGGGAREVILFTAYDCPTCRALDRELSRQAKSLNVTVYIVPTALRYAIDPGAKPVIQSVLCSPDRARAWEDLITKGFVAQATNSCGVNPDDYAFLSRSFPVRFPQTVPTAVTPDGAIYPLVMAKFDEVFRGR